MTTSDLTPAVPAAKAAARIEIFRAEQAQTLTETGMMTVKALPTEFEPHFGTFAEAAHTGSVTRVLFQAPGSSGFSLVYAWFKSNFPLPAHTHNSDCLYYVVSGELALGTQVLRAGDGFHVPANAVYSYVAGPQGVEVLEFRGACAFDFGIRQGTPKMWERMSGLWKANLDTWRTEQPPVRDSQGLG